MVERDETQFQRDRNLLFGVLAVHLKEVSPQELAEAAVEWTSTPGRELAEVLQEKGLLSREGYELVELAVEKRLKAHQGNAQAALADFGGERVVQMSFSGSISSGPKQGGLSLASFGGDHQPQLEKTPDTVPVLKPEETPHLLPQAGRYTIKSELDRGGIGRILIAFDETIGREVALKELLTERTSPGTPSGRVPSPVTAEASARFLQEARITGQLEHPGIVPVYELSQWPDGTMFYAMKLVRGKTLTDALRPCASLSERLKFLPQFLRVCETMAYAHSKNVIHRDLKPQNIMIGEFGETVVLDWGLAKVKGIKDVQAHELEKGLALIKSTAVGETIPGSPMGTPSYMSPEQAEGRINDIDERSDVWGLGAILYEILTGRPPFLGTSAREVILKVILDRVVPVREREPGAPAELCAICEKCLEKEREKRYEHAGEVQKEVAKVTLDIFGPMSFLQVREERNVALEQMRIAEEQRALAEKREQEARENLAEAYFQYGLRAEQEKRWPEAKIYFAKALALSERKEVRAAYLREPLTPLRVIPVAEFASEEDQLSMVYLSPDGKIALTAGGTHSVLLWALDTGKFVMGFPGHGDRVNAAVLSPEGKYLLSASEDHNINVWDVSQQKYLLTLRGHQGGVNSVSFSPEGRYVLSASQDRTLRLWSLFEGKCKAVFLGHADSVSSAVFSPDGKYILSASEDRSLKIWATQSSQCLLTLSGHTGGVMGAVFSPDGRSVLSWGKEGKLRLWSLAARKCEKVLAGHEVSVNAAAFSRDGKHILSGGCAQKEYLGLCVAGEIKLWSVESGECLLTIAGHEREVIAVSFLPNKQIILSASRDNTIKFWPINWELFTLSGEALFFQAQKEAGLILEGFKLVPGNPLPAFNTFPSLGV